MSAKPPFIQKNKDLNLLSTKTRIPDASLDA
jgi:hypothetical protein